MTHSLGRRTFLQALAAATAAAPTDASSMGTETGEVASTVGAEDVSGLKVLHPPSGINIVRTASHNLTSKLGAALYKRVETEPAHALKEPAFGGGWWEISEPQIDLTMVGAIGDATSGSSGYDNGTVLADAFGYASMFGGAIKVPKGIYRTTQGVTVTLPDVKKAPGIVGEGKGASCFLMGTGDFAILEMESCARAVVEKVGFYKDATTDGGIGLKLSRMPWFRLTDVGVEGVFGAGGFERGVYLQNCLSSKIDLTARDNVYGLYADYLVDGTKFTSRPNHLEIRGNYGRNKRWGIRIDEPGQLDLMAILEGNGWGAADTFRGGLYMPNAGTEGGSINIHNCYFELNAGTADIWTPQVVNPGTTFNVYGNYFANLENARSVMSHINIDNAVEVHYNVIGNKFDSGPAYTPSHLRKAITATKPDLVTINLGGDKSQFSNLTEWPEVFGSMGLSYGGYVSANGAHSRLPAGWSCSREGVGTYIVTPPTYLSLAEFACTATAMNGKKVRVERLYLDDHGRLVVMTMESSKRYSDCAFSWTAVGIR